MRRRRTKPLSRLTPKPCLLMLLPVLGLLLGYQVGLMGTGKKRSRAGMVDLDAMEELQPRRDSWVTRTSDIRQYAHMAMLESLGNGSIIAAWQASETCEGAMSQHIEYAISDDGLGEAWSPPIKLRLGQHTNASSERGGQWGPVLHNDDRGHVWLFFSESHADCIKPHVEGRLPQRYIIGGDIKVARLNLASQRWSPAVTLYTQDLDGNIPKLTANKLVVLNSGEWILPFWRERSGLVCKSGKNTKTSAGVLISADGGRSWEGHAVLVHSHSWLIENTLVEVASGELVMFFRTSLGWVFQTRSADKGRTWGVFEPVPLPNPDSKIHALGLQGSGRILLAFNDHAKFLGEHTMKTRTHLKVGVTDDEGASWRRALTVVDSVSPGWRYSYPTMLVHGCTLLVAYSVTFERCLSHCGDVEPVLLPEDHVPSRDRLGIRVSSFDLRALDVDSPLLDSPE